jgi:protein-S-isoprenylcysteine O-methyltransferase Ste14
LLTLGWHYPSDVLGGYLVAVTWTQFALAALFVLDARRAGRSFGGEAHTLSMRAALTPPAGAVIVAVALAGLVALAHPHAVITFAHLHKAFVVGAVAIGALALAFATAVMLGVRASSGSPPAPSPARR